RLLVAAASLVSATSTVDGLIAGTLAERSLSGSGRPVETRSNGMGKGMGKGMGTSDRVPCYAADLTDALRALVR
ncbi:MAG: hypothetical protein AAGE52_38160, partial [Myxococcota bacterium]